MFTFLQIPRFFWHIQWQTLCNNPPIKTANVWKQIPFFCCWEICHPRKKLFQSWFSDVSMYCFHLRQKHFLSFKYDNVILMVHVSHWKRTRYSILKFREIFQCRETLLGFCGVKSHKKPGFFSFKTDAIYTKFCQFQQMASWNSNTYNSNKCKLFSENSAPSFVLVTPASP